MPLKYPNVLESNRDGKNRGKGRRRSTRGRSPGVPSANAEGSSGRTLSDLKRHNLHVGEQVTLYITRRDERVRCGTAEIFGGDGNRETPLLVPDFEEPSEAEPKRAFWVVIFKPRIEKEFRGIYFPYQYEGKEEAPCPAILQQTGGSSRYPWDSYMMEAQRDNIHVAKEGKEELPQPSPVNPVA